MTHKYLAMFAAVAIAVSALALSSCAGAGVKHYRVKVVNEYPHDETSYTQGLFFLDGELFETTGQYRESTLRKVDIVSGEAVRRLDFSDKYFVEGSVALDGDIYVLTWKNKEVFIYDAKTLEYKSSWSYSREGWGLTTDGTSLIASDGSARLYFYDKELRQQKALTVKLGDKPVRMLNELEWIDGKIWANVYLTDDILIINPKNGKVEAVVDCTGLLPKELSDDYTDVLNGIAHNPETGKTYLTGKYWKRMYEVVLEEK